MISNRKTVAGERVIVGMSGGVDSSVAALLLRRQGFDVGGVFMKNWDETDPQGPCPAEIDARDALAVCDEIGIGLDAVSFAERYRERVFARFLADYEAGRTPNPDVLCNSEIKFRAFLDYALAQGAAWIATGHYAAVERRDGRCVLLKGADPDKDQSYFLHALSQEQLGRAIFPLGEYRKPQVRELARAAGLATHAKKDSTGICFIGERRFREFLAGFLAARPGEIRSVDGELLGEHEGLMFHTLGQRKGLRIGGRAGGSGEPWYVVDKDLAGNILLVAQGYDHPLLYSGGLVADELNWIAPAPAVGETLRCSAKTRYRQPDQDCAVEALGDGRCRVRFDRPQRAVTPGQSVVFYHGRECLGGGVIAEVIDGGLGAGTVPVGLAMPMRSEGGRRGAYAR
jgi:tRNA-specific 2-thiouridylase